MPTPEQINSAYPIVAIIQYRSGWKVERKSLIDYRPPPRENGILIKELSRRSLSKLAFTAMNTESDFASMITLTYPAQYPSDGRQVKQHLNKFLTYMRRKVGKFEYLWFLEFQARGAPHFHILTTLKASNKDRETMAEIWADIVSETDIEWDKVKRVHNHKSSWERIRSKHGAQAYALKYALKTRQKIVPEQYQNVGAFWRCSRGARPKPLETFKANEKSARIFLEAMGHTCAKWDVIPSHILKY